MRISVLTIGAIASIIAINSVFADSQTVTTQNYVDTQVETKQNKITASGTGGQYNVQMPDSVITDTDTDGVVAKRFVVEGADNGGHDGFMYENDWMGQWLATGTLSNNLGTDNFMDINTGDIKKSIVPVGVLEGAFNTVQRQLNLKQKTKTCVRYLDGAAETSENCLLWNLPD